MLGQLIMHDTAAQDQPQVGCVRVSFISLFLSNAPSRELGTFALLSSASGPHCARFGGALSVAL